MFDKKFLYFVMISFVYLYIVLTNIDEMGKKNKSCTLILKPK